MNGKSDFCLDESKKAELDKSYLYDESPLGWRGNITFVIRYF